MNIALGLLLSFSLLLSLTAPAQSTKSDLDTSIEKAMVLLNDYLNTPAKTDELNDKARMIVNSLKTDRTLMQSFGALYTKGEVRDHKRIQTALTKSIQTLKSKNQIRVDEKEKGVRLQMLAKALNDSKDAAELRSTVTYVASAMVATSFIVSRVVIANSGYGTLSLQQQIQQTLSHMGGYFINATGLSLTPFTATINFSVVMGAIAASESVHDRMMEQNLEIE